MSKNHTKGLKSIEIIYFTEKTPSGKLHGMTYSAILPNKPFLSQNKRARIPSRNFSKSKEPTKRGLKSIRNIDFTEKLLRGNCI